jgi:hypothetical protein
MKELSKATAFPTLSTHWATTGRADQSSNISLRSQSLLNLNNLLAGSVYQRIDPAAFFVQRFENEGDTF